MEPAAVAAPFRAAVVAAHHRPCWLKQIPAPVEANPPVAVPFLLEQILHWLKANPPVRRCRSEDATAFTEGRPLHCLAWAQLAAVAEDLVGNAWDEVEAELWS